jgi:predicted nucleic acid-binding protein
MKFNAKEIVIDADVARSAGLSEHPVSKNARCLFDAILNSKIVIVFCPVLLEEWKKHRSTYAQRWLSSMIAKKRFSLITPATIAAQEIECAVIEDEQRKIAFKDAHVVDIALSTCKFIASNDVAARDIFCHIAITSVIFDDLFWAVPTNDGEELVNVISEKKYVPPKWMVRNVLQPMGAC